MLAWLIFLNIVCVVGFSIAGVLWDKGLKGNAIQVFGITLIVLAQYLAGLLH